MIRSLYFALGLLLICTTTAVAEETELQRAQESYEEGLHATTMAGQERALNRALRAYLHLETEQSSAALYQRIGDCYFALGQYGFATLYYLRGLRLDPRNEELGMSLTAIAEKTAIEPVCRLSPPISPREQWLVAGLLALLLFVCLSARIWWPASSAHFSLCLGITALLLCCGCLGWGLWMQYGVPLHAVVVRSTQLDNGVALLEGNCVSILQVSDDGQTLQVQTTDGHLSSISYRNVRIL